jgi:pSer/pThr/pTyr-binding forkhead associated (FHA) protein
MWKLTIEDDEGKQTSLPLAHDEYALGRAESNSIRLTDRNISRKHAILARSDQGWTVRDIDSYNGTFVNGVRVVGDQSLRHGDLVQLGDYRLELIDESLLTAPTPTPAGRGTTLSPLHTRPDRLVMIVGPTPGAEFPLVGDRLTIGRSEECPISINHSSVSRHHAELIKIDKGRYEVIDKGSANGIRINGVELKRGLLEAGDALELGDVRLRFVGAGKIFRPVETTQYPVVAPGVGEHAGPASGPGRSGGWRVIAIVAVVLLVGGAAVYAMTRPPTDTVPKGLEGVPPEAAQEDMDRAKLKEAKAALDAKDVQKAHDLLQAIPETSPVRDDPAFQEIEARWADSLLEKAKDKSKPAKERFDLLAQVASASSVDRPRRDQAIAMLQEISTENPELPKYTPPPRPTTGRPDPNGVAQPPNGPPPGPQPSTAPSKNPESIPPPQGAPEKSQYASQRRVLEPKVWAGKATIDEIKLLRAMCSHDGDRLCRDRANTMLRQKEREQQAGN